MGPNIMLALTLIGLEEEVPDDVLQAALEDLQLDIMNCDVAANKYLLEQLYDAIVQKDKDAVVKVASLAKSVFDIRLDDSKRRCEKIAIEAGKKFIGEEEDDVRVSILNELLEKIEFMPIAYEDNLLVGMIMADEDYRVLVMAVNEDAELSDISHRFDGLGVEDSVHAFLRGVGEDEEPHYIYANMTYEVGEQGGINLEIKGSGR